MKENPGIYVEIRIRSTVDEIWSRTQTPEIHELWDLRFTTIRYLPRYSEGEPQTFLYSTRIGFGVTIAGEGESTGTSADAEGARTSALSFWSNDPKSLISEGSGYWRYVPLEDSVRFLTWYDYRTRFGLAGRLLDHLAFRPLIGWATAWSFDRLRLWIERGTPPETSLRMALIHACSRASIALIWVWQGLVPKLLFPSADEKFMLAAAGAPIRLLPTIGVVEIAFGVLGIALWRWRAFFLLNVLHGFCPPCGHSSFALLSVQRLQRHYPQSRCARPVLGRLYRKQGTAVRSALPPSPPRTADMNSIYQRVLGSDFARLHPEIQRRFGFSSTDRVAAIGTGMMQELWHGPAYTLPFLYVGSWRNIMFPESARNVPFQILNYAYLDSFGRETVTWIRKFQTRRPRRFDAYMIYSEQRRKIVDYLGTHQHLAVDIDLSVAPNGGMALRSDAQRFYEGHIGFSFPMIFSGVAHVCEWYDDAAQCFRIEVDVRNRRWGPLFGYKGTFQVEWLSVDSPPQEYLPLRTERRE